LSWAVTTRLMAEGKSFSGRERNSFFLNVGNGRFADVSGLSGFDFLDDARSLCIVDWDFDGALDFWAYNRNSPRLRLMRNAFGAGTKNTAPAHWVAFELHGVTCNRDAIGARVEVTTPSGTQMRTLRAGEGFLSQSSKWLHVGLGDDTEISKVTVRWPGAEVAQIFTSVTPDAFHRLEQGTSAAMQWMPPNTSSALHAADQPSLPVDESARIVLAARPPVPPLEIIEDIAPGTPMLINVWATWCGPCLEELGTFVDRAEDFEQNNLKIVLLNADDPAESDRPAKVAATLRKLRCPFDSRLPDERSIRILDAFQRALTQRQRPLPLPASFLVDAEGRVAVVYKGKADVDTILADVGTLATGPDAWRAQATPFAGQWYRRPPQPNPLRIAMKFLDLDEADLSAAYLEKFLSTNADTIDSKSALADVYFALGRARATGDQKSAAAKAYQSAIKTDPRYRKAYVELGHMLLDSRSFDAADRLLSRAVQLDKGDADTVVLEAMARFGMGKFVDVEKLCRYALTLQPNHVTARYNLAFALQQLDLHREAAENYARLLGESPGQIMAANNLAWLFATSPDDAVRNGLQAIKLSRKLCDSAAGAKQPIFWMTLGAAYGESGDFGNATISAQRALELCDDIPKGSTLPSTLQQHLQSYQQGKAVRD
jgi:tetratricopeptide (TPR) repeat protein